jgi:predicted transposase/invertase (TIGR01784 family)
LDDDDKKVAVGLRSATLQERILQVEIEMQASHMKYDNIDNNFQNLISRSVYYLCDIHAKQSKEDKNYEEFCQSYQATICKFTIFPDEERFVNEFVLTNTVYGNRINIISNIFVELSKKNLSEALNKQVKDLAPLEQWAIFFGYADDPKQHNLLIDFTNHNGRIRTAMEILTDISQNKDEQLRYRSHQKYVLDFENAIRAAKRLGHKEGHEEGLKEGLKEGVEEGTRDTTLKFVKNLIKMNLSDEQIQEATGLTLSEIKKLIQ